MDYSKYKKSRDLSWQILINHNITEFPVKVSHICKDLNINIISYAKAERIISDFGLKSNTLNSDGFTFNRIIFYNNNCAIDRQRFTVAHELGHILLHNGRGLYNREPIDHDNPIEQEANVFASRLLAPACVLWGIGVNSAEDISRLCNISMQSAVFRFERIKELYERERIFLNQHGKSCFLLSPLERQVYNKFSHYISEHRL